MEDNPRSVPFKPANDQAGDSVDPEVVKQELKLKRQELTKLEQDKLAGREVDEDVYKKLKSRIEDLKFRQEIHMRQSGIMPSPFIAEPKRAFNLVDTIVEYKMVIGWVIGVSLIVWCMLYLTSGGLTTEAERKKVKAALERQATDHVRHKMAENLRDAGMSESQAYDAAHSMPIVLRPGQTPNPIITPRP